MANVAVILRDGKFEIVLDHWEWETLKVDGNDIPITNPRGSGHAKYDYLQEEAVDMEFEATASNLIDVKLADKSMFLLSEDRKETYYFLASFIRYETHTILRGFLRRLPFVYEGAIEPTEMHRFYQKHLTGEFFNLQPE